MSIEGRILAIDYGEKRVGLALSDPMRMFAKPLCILANDAKLIPELLNIIRTQGVSMLLLGMPYAIDGSLTPKTMETQAFAEQLTQSVSIPVQCYDERYSTCEADAELKRMGYTWQEAKKVKDAMAACMFLKNYLER